MIIKPLDKPIRKIHGFDQQLSLDFSFKMSFFPGYQYQPQVVFRIQQPQVVFQQQAQVVFQQQPQILVHNTPVVVSEHFKPNGGPIVIIKGVPHESGTMVRLLSNGQCTYTPGLNPM